jgi:hypothetical protein
MYSFVKKEVAVARLFRTVYYCGYSDKASNETFCLHSGKIKNMKSGIEKKYRIVNRRWYFRRKTLEHSFQLS